MKAPDVTKRHAIAFSLLVAFGAAGAAGHLSPTPKFPENHTKFASDHTGRSNTERIDLATYTPLFDRGALPDLKPPPQPAAAKVDPFAALKRYRLTGVIESDSKSIVILTGGQETLNKSLGDRVAGAELVEITPDMVRFAIDNEFFELKM